MYSCAVKSDLFAILIEIHKFSNKIVYVTKYIARWRQHKH